MKNKELEIIILSEDLYKVRSKSNPMDFHIVNLKRASCGCKGYAHSFDPQTGIRKYLCHHLKRLGFKLDKVKKLDKKGKKNE